MKIDWDTATELDVVVAVLDEHGVPEALAYPILTALSERRCYLYQKLAAGYRRGC
jgi:hypothetical protein